MTRAAGAFFVTVAIALVALIHAVTLGASAAPGNRHDLAAKPKPSAPAATVKPTPTHTPIPTPTPVVAPTVDTIPEPSPAPSPQGHGTLSHSIVYDNGAQIIMLPAGGGSPVALANLSTSPYPFKRPRFAGTQFMYYDKAFYLGDIYGHHTAVPSPAAAGEQVFDAVPSPDGQYIAWVLVKAAPWHGALFSMGSSRVVLTNQSGGTPRVLVQQNIDADGGVPIVFGWRNGQPYTLLLQNSYGFVGLHKGLQEFDPALGDLVGDWLPPIGNGSTPSGETLGLSPSGQSIVYATSDRALPSGEGPLPVNLYVISLDGRRISRIDLAAQHKDKALPKQPAPSAYFFSRQAFVSPDETLVAYTRLDAIYPKGATVPVIRPIAAIARANGAGKADLVADFHVAGWADASTLVLDKAGAPRAGLYSYNIGNNQKTLIAAGSNLTVDGIVP